MREKIKILQLNYCDGLFGGIESLILNIYRNINKNKIEFTFLTYGKSTYKLFEDEIIEMGGKIDEIIVKKGILQNIIFSRKLYEYLKKEKPDILHTNISSLTIQIMVLLVAWLANIKIRIVHCHNFKKDSIIIKSIKQMLKPIISLLGTDYFACSEEAAKWMFSKKIIKEKRYKIIKNGIELEKFKYNAEKREEYRSKFNITQNKVVGHIGRFQNQKNHKFIIEVFKALVEKDSSFFLVLIGEGELEKEIREKVKKLKLDDKVKFLGARKDINHIMQAVDIILFPSLFEGFGIVALESQAAGLPTIVSDRLPKEIEVTNLLKKIPLENSIEEWCEEIFINIGKREGNVEEKIKKLGYSIKETTQELEAYYKKCKVGKI